MALWTYFEEELEKINLKSQLREMISDNDSLEFLRQAVKTLTILKQTVGTTEDENVLRNCKYITRREHDRQD